MYSSPFRGLVKSMLRKNPELRPSAAELLNHPHLQPFIHKIHLKLNTPRRSTFPFQWHDSSYLRRNRFFEPESVSTISDRHKRLSFSNDRALNPSISGTEAGSVCSAQRAQGSFTYSKERLYDLSVGCVREEWNSNKSKAAKFSGFDTTPRLRAGKISTPRRQIIPSISHTSSKRDSLPASPATKFAAPTRRASLPLFTPSTGGMATATPYRASIGLLRSVESPDISVNAPRIDKIAEFPLASCEGNHFFPVRGTSSTLAHCSSSSPGSAECSFTKDKCTVQVVDKASVPKTTTIANDTYPNGTSAPVSHGSECSEPGHPVLSSHSSADSRQHRFDTSSYQQRAEALEGLLEFSARLLQQQRFEELGVLLKPFGPEKVSPRETAIWLTKSFKETAS
ncbi:hypothetical protein PIB30_012799 [Stylosanthes scabra]|uniref:Uncharacterized protein n=1 Tax=Stylosanthes scabra TaxID=79078 RepID=A0ABU6T622_9FABA|nr:hypothetical protein [Stylosanthes scabra]